MCDHSLNIHKRVYFLVMDLHFNIIKYVKREKKRLKQRFKEFYLIFVSFRITNHIILPLFPSDPVDKQNQPKRSNVVF